jgi:hypothetical protein
MTTATAGGIRAPSVAPSPLARSAATNSAAAVELPCPSNAKSAASATASARDATATLNITLTLFETLNRTVETSNGGVAWVMSRRRPTAGGAATMMGALQPAVTFTMVMVLLETSRKAAVPADSCAYHVAAAAMLDTL